MAWLLLAGVATASTSPRTLPEAAASSQAVPIADRAGLTNLYRVSEGLLRGAQPKANGFASLAEMGVATVIDLRAGHDEKKACEASGLRCVHIPMHAWNSEESDVVRFLTIVAQENNRPVFVHCRRGADRTGMVVAVYRVVVQGWTKEAALQEMTKGPYGYNPIWRNLKRYVENMDVAALREAAGLAPPSGSKR